MLDQESLDFDAQDEFKQIELPVTYRGKQYTLRKASVDAVVRFKERASKGASYQDGKIVRSLEGTSDLEPYLVSLCLWETVIVNGKNTERNVSLQEIKTWEADVVRTLHMRAKKISRAFDEARPDVLALLGEALVVEEGGHRVFDPEPLLTHLRAQGEKYAPVVEALEYQLTDVVAKN